MEKTQNTSKTEAELHADLVADHINELEGIKQAVVDKQHFEAAQVISQSITLIKSAHISNVFLTKENAALKANLRMHIAGMAMNALVSAGVESCTKTIAKKAFALAEDMLLEAENKE